MKTGRLYGVGLGPGDPDLLTLRAARLIAAAQVVAYPVSTGGESFARSIAAEHIASGAREIAIDVPMRAERQPAQAAYDMAASAIAAELAAGHDVVVLCEGDPLFFGSFMYIHARLSGDFDCEIVPGVTSVSAAAARIQVPLAARNQQFSVLPAPLPEADLQAGLAAADAVAILKLGRHLGKVRSLLGAMGLTDRATYVERVGLADERVCKLAEAPEMAPYFSMVLVTKGGDPWL